MKRILIAVTLILSSSSLFAGTIQYLQNLEIDKKATFGVSNSSHAVLEFKNSSNTNTITLVSTTTSSNFTLILPTAPGTNTQSLATDGSGQLFFQNSSTFSTVNVQDIIGNSIQGSTHTHINFNYDTPGKFNFSVSSSVLLDGQTINVNNVNADGDVSVNRDKKIILDKNSGSDTDVTNNSSNNNVEFFRNAELFMRFKD